MHASGTALVTGASRGIGRAVALELARVGFDVVATMRDPAAGADLPGAVAADAAGSLRVARLDVTDPSTIEIPDGLRLLINNAGVETANESVEFSDVDGQWRYLFEANVFGLVAVTQRAIPKLRAAGGGVICNVTSSSVLAPVPFLGMYRASKAAVTAMGESLAAEVAQFGIRVVEVMPGPIETDMLRASEKRAEAGEHPEYAALADTLWEGRRMITDQYTPAHEAARRIAAACTRHDAPQLLRVGCDDLAEGMVEAWKVTPHDVMIASILAYYAS